MPPRVITVPDDSLATARHLVLEGRGHGEGVICPTCGQQATVYDRRITTPMARGLSLFYRHYLANGDTWFNFPNYAASVNLGRLGMGGDWAKLSHWGLLERRQGHREDGSSRVGDARITPLGRRFCLGQVTLPQIARIYNGRLLGFTGPQVSILDAIGRGFRYDELFVGVAMSTAVPEAITDPVPGVEDTPEGQDDVLRDLLDGLA